MRLKNCKLHKTMPYAAFLHSNMKPYSWYKLSTADILEKFKILNVENTLRYNNLLMMYKIDRGLMKSSYTLNRDRQHNYNTRNACLPRLNQCRTNLGQNSILRACTAQYRALPASLTLSQSIFIFKKELKKRLLNGIFWWLNLCN